MAVLSITALYFLVPVWWLIVSSTKSNGSLFSSNGFWFDEPQLVTNLVQLFTRQDGAFSMWMLNSLFYAGVGGVFATLFGLIGERMGARVPTPWRIPADEEP